jgi:tetratricopeptide (TPR) repeat protein
MSPRTARAQLLLARSKYPEAEAELRLALADDPNDALAHAFLAIAMSAQERHPPAIEEARAAIGLDPEEPYFHYVLSRVYLGYEEVAKAQRAIAEALRLEPAEADYLCVLARIQLHERRFAESLRTIDRGLAAEPDHVDLTNLRAMVLTKLGRGDEAAAAAAESLREDPENAETHAVRGWTLLENRDVTGALEHFRESLRLDPSDEYARLGMLEALKANSRVYRWLQRFFFWASRQTKTVLWAFLIGSVVLRRVLIAVAEKYPAFEPVAWTVVWAIVLFFLITWLAKPLSNSLLRLNRFGRYVLSPRERLTSNVFLGIVAAAVASLCVGFAVELEAAFIIAIILGFMAVPISAALGAEERRPRQIMQLYAGGLSLVAASLVVSIYAFPESFITLFWVFMIGWIAFGWVAGAVESMY